MSVSNLFKPGGLAWQPDANNINAPDGVLLRADNMVPDENGALTVRRGTDELYTFPLGTEDIHSLHTVELRDGYTYRMMGADDTLYKNPGPGNHTAIWERQFGLDEEKIVNGEFTTNATGWTLGTNWAWEAGGRVRHTTGNTAAMSQSIYVVSGTTYNVSVKFHGTDAGTVAVTLGGVAATGITGATGTATADVVANTTGFVSLAITPVSAFDGAVTTVSVITDKDDASSFEFLTQFNYTGGSWEKTYAATDDVGPVPFTTVWEGPTGNDYISGLVTTLEPVNFNVTFGGSGDIAFGNDSGQIFMARGVTKKKFDGKSLMNWGIAKPTSAPTLTAVTPSSVDVAPFDNADSPGYTVSVAEGVNYTPVFVTGSDGTASGALEVTPVTYNRQTGINVFRFFGDGKSTDPQDFQDIDGSGGSDQDIFDIAIKMEDPEHIKYIQIGFNMVDTTDGNKFDRYAFYIYPKEGTSVQVKDTKLEGQNVYETNLISSLNPVAPKDKPRESTPAEVKATLAEVGSNNTQSGSSSSTTTDKPPANEWVHFSWTRSQFTRVGTQIDQDWSEIDSISIVVSKDKGYFGKVTFDDLVIYSAGEGTLTGQFRACYRWVRETDNYYELSPPSDLSDPIYLFANQLKVTIPAASQNAADDQVTDTWVYIYGGFLDTAYRAATATADPQLNSALDVLVDKSEIEIITENEVLEPYLDEPQDNIIAIAGPWNGRMFTLTSEGYVFPSLQTAPNVFNTYQVVDLSGLGDPLWMVKTSSGIHVGCEKDVVFLAGSGDEDADRVVIDLYPHPLNIGTPPIDKAVYVDGNSILYRSKDGLITLASQGLSPVPDGGTSLLWRGQARHGVSALNIATGRFRLTVDNAIMYVLAPEGTTTDGTTVVYRMDLKKGQWSRLVMPKSLLSILTEPDGTLIAGTDGGKLLQLESGTGDTGVNPSVTILTPFMDGGNPLVRKDAFDLQLHCDTNNNTATVSVYKDGATSATASYSVVTTVPQAYRIQANGVGSFVRAQIGLTGTFDELILSALNLSYRVRPQHMTYLDTGYILGNDPADVVWLQEVEVDANSPSNLSVLVYLDDTLFTTESVSVTANIRTVYRVPLPRGTKSRRPRIVVKTTASDGAGEIGFDPYFVRVRTRSSGNQSGNQFKTVWPAGSAP